MSTDILDAVGHLPLQGLHGARFDVFVSEHCLTFSPALNALKQRTRLIPARLARGLRSVQMDMWLNERWDSQTAFSIKHFTLW